MSLKDAFYSQKKMPMETVQRSINRRPHQASKFFKKIGKNLKKIKTGRKPNDIRPRSMEPIPPFHEEQGIDGHKKIHPYTSKPK